MMGPGGWARAAKVPESSVLREEELWSMDGQIAAAGLPVCPIPSMPHHMDTIFPRSCLCKIMRRL